MGRCRVGSGCELLGRRRFGIGGCGRRSGRFEFVVGTFWRLLVGSTSGKILEIGSGGDSASYFEAIEV
jgi:hypothetical protein